MKLSLDYDLFERLIDDSSDGEIADAFLNDGYFAFDEADLASVASHAKKGLPLPDCYKKVLLTELDQEAKEYLAKIQVGFGLDEINALDPSPYRENPYFKLVMGIAKETRIGPWSFHLDVYKPYQLFVYDEVRQSEATPFASYSPIGTFVDGFSFPALSKGGRTYMSLIPHEINTMAKPIEKAHGRVLTMGLGMGYFAFMTSQKDDVSEVAILERDKQVIDLFRRLFLPLFDHPEKIRIIQVDDALSFHADEPYDYLFADLHHDASDGLIPYLSIVKREDLAKDIDVWIEKAILEYFRRHVIALLNEESEDYGDADYQDPKTDSERILSALHAHLKNVPVESEEDLLNLLSDENLRAIAKSMRFPR